MMSISDTGRYPAMVQNQNPEAGMLHNQLPTAWPWPKGADKTLQAEREAMSGPSQVRAPHPDAIDRDAYDRFMRSLG